MRLVYYRKDKRTGRDARVSLAKAKDNLIGYYKKDTIVPMLRDGTELQTDFAIYWAEEK